MLKSCHQISEQDHNTERVNRCLENVAQCKYFGMTITNQNLIEEEIKRRFNSDNACYHSVQNPLSSCLLSKNVKIRIYKTIILPVVLYGCLTWYSGQSHGNSWLLTLTHTSALLSTIILWCPELCCEHAKGLKWTINDIYITQIRDRQFCNPCKG
jgi:hypothetical protein